MLKRFLILIFILMLITGPASAQEVDWLVIAVGNQLWAITDLNDPEPTPIPFCTGHEALASPLVMAPNGDHLAYVSQTGTEAATSPLPTVVWLCNGINREAYAIGIQPSSATGQDIYRAYGRPDWSPDSTSLAWTGLTVTPNGVALALFRHDIASRQTETLLDAVPLLSQLTQPPRLAWGQPGLIIHNSADHEFLFYTPGRQDLLHYAIPREAGKAFVQDFFWYLDRVAVVFNNGAIELFDPAGVTWEPVTALQAYAREAPRNGVRLDYSNSWNVRLPTGDLIPLPYNRLPGDNAIALGPSGNAVAYITDGLYVWRGGQTILIDIPTADYANASLVWSPLVWTLP